MADVQLTITIPEAYIPRAIEAFNGIAGKQLELTAIDNGFNGNWNFVIPPKQVDESQIQFGKRVFKSLGLATVRLWDFAEDQDRYRTAVSEIPEAKQDVPDDILT